MDKITAILRKEKNPYTGEFEPIVFFPEFSAMFGKVVCYDGCHNEADINYYAKTKPATPSEYPDFWKDVVVDCVGRTKAERAFIANSIDETLRGVLTSLYPKASF